MMEIPCVCLGILGIVLMSLGVLIFLYQYEFLARDRAGIDKTLLELLEVDFFEGLSKLLAYQNLVLISGESGTGRTTLALIGPDHGSIVETWI
jgi:hypothetical protein